MDDTLKNQVREAIVRCLRLPVPPGDIQDTAPLFGEGLGLDSVDALELILELERTFGVRVTDEQVGARVLRSVTSIVEFIEASRTHPTTP
jgi:acyl carrier protein